MSRRGCRLSHSEPKNVAIDEVEFELPNFELVARVGRAWRFDPEAIRRWVRAMTSVNDEAGEQLTYDETLAWLDVEVLTGDAAAEEEGEAEAEAGL